MSFFSDVKMWLVTEKKPFKMIEKSLPHTKKSGDTTWWLSDLSWQNFALEITQQYKNGWSSTLPFKMLKNTSTRRVFLIRTEKHLCVAKSFNFRGSFGRKIFRHRLFGRDEAISLIIAKQNKIPVPKLYGYGETRSSWMCYESIQLLEYIEDGLTYPDFIQHGKSQQKYGLERLIRLVFQLYQAGCLHPDPHYEQFLLSTRGEEYDRIIDFQYAQFGQQSLNQFVYQLAHLFRSLRVINIEIDSTTLSLLLAEQLQHIDLSEDDQERWHRVFTTYLNANKDLSRQQIMKLR